MRGLLAAWSVAFAGAGLYACATADGGVGDLDAGATSEGGTPAAKDGSVVNPPKKDAGSNAGDPDTGVVGDPDASTCVKAPPSNMCGVAPQCGCSSIETCDIQDNTGAVACAIAGTGGTGKACTQTAGCARGSTCINSVCKPYCPATLQDGGGCGLPGTGTCSQITDGTNKPIPNFKVCRVACDLENPTSCDLPTAPAGVVGCDLDDTNQPDCFPAGTSKGGCGTEPDGGYLRCAPSYVCVTITQNDAGTSSCKNWCKVADKHACGDAGCGGFSTPLKVNGVEYGACP